LKPYSNVITCQNNLPLYWLVNNGQYGAIIIDVFSQGILASVDLFFAHRAALAKLGVFCNCDLWFGSKRLVMKVNINC